ncbi:S9 family peptidase [Sandarakinorhabdus cyanobacteriorum]|uniref:Acyl-peptide hydrolase n=1 Tax=Sandarakinorhabdus cyanobacteriorum TaxID=1981098 RepID=A0A255YG99_9SPHN|nr:S9 family peptidase [Sandarakinorhabdus cyanobacteriorum]OYQ28193.1 S9 family peptidase [Sandarakinorhabdus cyanobacteriorum]
MIMKAMLSLGVMLAATTALAAPKPVPTPDRPVTDPASLTSPANPLARPLSVADLAFSRSLGGPVWSADGQQIFVTTNLTGRPNVWRMAAGGSWPVQMTVSDDGQYGLAVSADGKWLYFDQDKGGDEYGDIYRVPTAGGPVEQITATPDVAEGDALPAPTGDALVLAHKKRGAAQTNIAIIEAGKLRLLTDEADPSFNWQAVAFVDGGKALIANRSQTAGAEGSVWRIDVATGAAKQLIGRKGVVYSAAGASADGSRIAITSDEGSGQDHAGVLDAASGSVRWLPATPWEEAAVAMHGKAMLVRTNRDGRSSLALVDVDSLVQTPLALPPGLNAASGKAFAPDGRSLLLIHAGADTPTDLFRFDLASGSARPLTQTALASVSPEALPKSEIVSFKSFDGTLISAVLTMPANLKRDASAPAIVLPHGGPTGQSQDGFSRNAALFASHGYMVIQPNFRGSTGYGRAFQEANRKDLGGGDLKDVLAARDFMVATGYVDPKRIGITGGSYGGFMTLMAIGKAPDAFAAAVQLFGIINWRTMWEHEDAYLQAYQRSLIGAPDEFKGVYEASSPLTYIKAAKVPLLSLQGENDIRVPRGQAQEVADILKAKGNVVETIFYPAEGHGFAKRENQLDSLTRTLAWFDKYLKK